MTTATQPPVQDKIEAIKSIATQIYRQYPIDTLGNLYGRWQDEKEFEDFAEYEKVMKKGVGEGCQFVKGTKRPFGFVVKITHQGIWATYQYSLNAKGEFLRKCLKCGKV